jgi:Protein of unknown function (DUF2806)
VDEPKSLMNLGDLAKPATTLVEKISDAIGGIARPWQIIRVAEAEAEAEKIRAVAQIEIGDLQRRAMIRFLAEEAKRQTNIEGITAKALPDVSPDAKPEQMEDDWVANFFDKCRLISDDEMQSLWARILAGEANSPGAFSKRTVDLVATLDKADAVLFSQLCSFGVSLGQLTPLVYDSNHEIYTKHGIDFGVVSHLASIGLIQFSELAGYVIEGLNQKGHVQYFGTGIWVEFTQEKDNALQVGKVLLTKAGRQLAPISGAGPIEGFVEYVQEQWKGFGYKTEPSIVTTSPASQV